MEQWNSYSLTDCSSPQYYSFSDKQFSSKVNFDHFCSLIFWFTGQFKLLSMIIKSFDFPSFFLLKVDCPYIKELLSIKSTQKFTIYNIKFLPEGKRRNFFFLSHTVHFNLKAKSCLHFSIFLIRMFYITIALMKVTLCKGENLYVRLCMI